MSITIGPTMKKLAGLLLDIPRPETSQHVFINQRGRPMSDTSFTTGWQRGMIEALEAGVIKKRFTIHDLRAFYTAKHKEAIWGLD